MKTSTLRMTIVEVLLGWLSLLSSYWALNGVIFLLQPEQNWGELGFMSASIFMSFLLSLGYALSVITIFLPWEYIKRRKNWPGSTGKEAIIGGTVWAIVVPIFSLIISYGITGGSFSGFMAEIASFCSAKGATWPISAIVSGALIFGLAARGAKHAEHKADAAITAQSSGS